jgi:hypothetical protein
LNIPYEVCDIHCQSLPDICHHRRVSSTLNDQTSSACRRLSVRMGLIRGVFHSGDEEAYL